MGVHGPRSCGRARYHTRHGVGAFSVEAPFLFSESAMEGVDALSMVVAISLDIGSVELIHNSKRIELAEIFQLNLITDRMLRYLETEQFDKLASVLALLLKADFALDSQTYTDHFGPSTLAVALCESPTRQSERAKQSVALARILLLKLDTHGSSTTPRCA